MSFSVSASIPFTTFPHSPNCSWTAWTIRFNVSLSLSNLLRILRSFHFLGFLQPWELLRGSSRLCSERTGSSKFVILSLLLLRFFTLLFPFVYHLFLISSFSFSLYFFVLLCLSAPILRIVDQFGIVVVRFWWYTLCLLFRFSLFFFLSNCCFVGLISDFSKFPWWF